MRTHLQHNIHKPKQFTNGTVRYSPRKRALSAVTKPTNYIEALQQTKWKQAMDEKYSALIKNNTWHLVPSQPNLNVISCKWVFRLKKKHMAALIVIKLV